MSKGLAGAYAVTETPTRSSWGGAAYFGGTRPGGGAGTSAPLQKLSAQRDRARLRLERGIPWPEEPPRSEQRSRRLSAPDGGWWEYIAGGDWLTYVGSDDSTRWAGTRGLEERPPRGTKASNAWPWDMSGN